MHAYLEQLAMTFLCFSFMYTCIDLMNDCSCYSKRCAVCTVYAVLFTILLLGIGITTLLGTVPQASPYSVPIHEGDTILLPVLPSPKWLTSISVETNGSCKGDLYKIPCDELSRAQNYAANYSTFAPGVPSHFDFIFCLKNSTFRFSIHPKYEGIMNKEVWLFDNYIDRTAAKNRNFSGLSCSNPPSYTRCVVLTNSTSSRDIVTWVPGEEGSFYNVLCRPLLGDTHPVGCVGVEFVISRFFYNTSTIANRHYGKVTSTAKLVVGLEPSNLDVCLLLNVTVKSCSAPYTDDYALLAPSRKQDFLLWPGLITLGILLVVVLVILIHFGWYCYRERYSQPEGNQETAQPHEKTQLVCKKI